MGLNSLMSYAGRLILTNLVLSALQPFISHFTGSNSNVTTDKQV
jgi:hypothetical protein